MKSKLLKEEKGHGTPSLPMATYIETIRPKVYEVSLHWHKGFEFVYISEGKATFTINLETYTVKKGDFLIVPPNALHSFTPLANHQCTCNTIVVDLSFLESNMLDSVTVNFIAPIINGDVTFLNHINPEINNYQAILNCHLSLINLEREKPLHYPLKIKASLFNLLVLLFDENLIINKPISLSDNNSIDALRRVMEYIYINRTEEISITQLASIAGYSNDHFIRFFKKHLHQTPINYINSYRINYARSLLESKNLNISEVAYESGFNDVSYFIKLFKSRYSLTPKDYRKSFECKVCKSEYKL